MRLRISLSAEGRLLQVPIQYNHLLQGLIYTNLDRALSEWLHEKGHTYGERRFMGQHLETFCATSRLLCSVAF
jgi:CRISPR-associated endoribonuclease Cas6